MDDEAELISRLLTLAGSIMEDASPIAIFDTGELSLNECIAGVGMAANQLSVLARAAEVVRGRLAMMT